MVIKRVVDLITSLLSLILLSPLFAIVALAIKLDSPGPVIFRQQRLGKGGEPFTIFKFRTMVDGAERVGLGLMTAENDPRITRVGRFLRRTSLDELPQLINVLRGEMSLVGPRPAPTSHAERYTGRDILRLSVRPGITGWAQVNGRNELTWDERIRLDIEYVENWSLWWDFKILWMTLMTVVSSRGVYSGRNEELVGRMQAVAARDEEDKSDARR